MEAPVLVRRLSQSASRHRSMLLPIFALALILVILVPLPTAIMNFLLLVNLMLSGLVLLTVMYIAGPLEFSSFPSLLLSMTLFRLVLNTATTRLILTKADAGQVVQTFGEFVASGSLVVAIIIFVIIVVIQFVVITKGATRIAEVAARFTLDGMPGKQMAVDADLNAGAITDEEAKRRRAEITREADFYGAMDGASKFVRGDAIAGAVITLVNILGGIYIGLVEMGLPLTETLRRFTILTIGDGLVSQLPAFILSIAAGMIVTRSASRTNLGEELLGQLVSQPIALALVAGFLGVLALTPLPKFPLLLLGSSCGAMGYTLTRQKNVALAQAAAKAAPRKREPVEKHLTPDVMELEVGFGLSGLVDHKQGGDLLERIANMRRQVAQELGIIVPVINIRSNIVQLGANDFRVKLRGLEVSKGEILPGHLLAISSESVTEPVAGIETKEPVFGLPALWIDRELRHEAEHRNYTVVEPSSVVGTVLIEIIKRHAHELLTRQEVNRLLDHLKERAPKLVEEIVPSVLKPGEIQRVLQSLLKERVPIRDLEIILETIGDVAIRTKDVEIMTEYARASLARTLCHHHAGDDGRLHCVTLDPSMETLIASHVSRSEHGASLTLPPAVQSRVVSAIRAQVERAGAGSGGRLPIVLCAPMVRVWVRKLIEGALPSATVMSYNEVVRGVEVETHGMAVLTDEA